MNKEINVYDYIKTKEYDTVGKVILLIGYPYRELYADMFPGADSGYEYITMYDEEEERVELRALNKYSIDDVTIITKEEFELHIESYFKLCKDKGIKLNRKIK